ncbi:5189_t:CDS:1, partial [Funneliformis geosporum]
VRAKVIDSSYTVRYKVTLRFLEEIIYAMRSAIISALVEEIQLVTEAQKDYY